MNVTFILLVILAYAFTLVNGFHDGCNVVATLIASRAMKPKVALAWAALVELISPFAIFIIGSSVSDTIKKLVSEACYTDPAAMSTALAFITGGLLAAVLWNLITWKFGIPASSSHALIGGIVGAGMAAFGTGAIAWNYFWVKVVAMIFITPLVSFIIGFLIQRLLNFILRKSHAGQRANVFFKYMQWFNMTFLAFNHAYNDSQKSIGIVMVIISIFGYGTGSIPAWVILIAALCLGLGIEFGGFNVIKTVGTGIYKVKPINSFASQLTAGTVILASSLLGAPVSASQIVSSSIMGVGTAERYKAVHWNVSGKILISWFITIPIAGTLGALFYLLFSLIF